MNIKKLRNITGFSLVEVLIASGLMALVSAGVVSMVTTMNKEQNNQFRTAALREIKSRIQYLITDQNSWAQTLAKNASGTAPFDSMACIKSKSACTPGIYNLYLFDSAGNAFFNPPDFTLKSPSWPAGGSPGFTDKGVACTNFNGNSSAGVDTCPITYKIVWEPVCPPTGTCKNPLIKITARMIYNSSSSAQVAAMSQGDVSGVGTGAAGWTDDTDVLKTGKYDVVIKRSATTINKSFKIEINSVTGALPGPGGTCGTGGAYVARGAAIPYWTRNPADDPFDLVSVSILGPDITIKAGTYSCRIMSVGYNVDTFYIRLTQGGVPVAGSLASSNAPSGSKLQSVANSSPVLSLITTSIFHLEQTCTTPDPNPLSRQYEMGLPATPYSSPSTFASITCTQTN